jgi:glucan 1,3-beta-glucosidase
MLASSDYAGSQHHLTKYLDQSAIPMHDYEKAGESRATTPGGGHYIPVHSKSEKYTHLRDKLSSSSTSRKKWLIFAGIVFALVLIAIVIAIPLVVLHDKAHENDGQGPASVPGTGSDGQVLTSGSDGSVIRMENGTTFTYVNTFGGQWRSGLTDNGAQAQSYTPPMNESWDYAKNPILGVNLGGWLVIEPFIVPSLFEPYENNSQVTYVVDEYTLMQQWEKEGGQSGKEAKLRQHYDSFITEYDFMLIAAAGLNWVRIPVGYWAIATMPGEPFVEGLSWEYFLKAVQWARKYGIRIKVDLHAVPGSANGYNHGGRLGVFNFLNSPSGFVAAERALDTIRVITEFIAQPDVSNVAPLFGILNEPNLPVGIGMDALRRFYIESYQTVRNVSGFGEAHPPFISYHDGFMGLSQWSGFMQNADRVAWDLHPYVCFVQPFGSQQDLIASACNGFAANEDQGLTQFGLTFAGEWSLASNDCGLYLNGPFQGVRYDGTFSSGTSVYQGQCGPFDDWQSFSNATKTLMYQGALAQMASFHNFFFWTWKIGDSLRTGAPVNPNWSYLLGLQQGWMPKDPYHESQNACANLQKQGIPNISKTALTWSSTFSDWQTGGAATYAPNTISYSWPPPSVASSGTTYVVPASSIATYTPTGAPLIPPTPTMSVSFSKEATPSIDPWVQGGRQTPAFTPISGCNYFDNIWNNVTSIPTGWPCSGSAAKRDVPFNLMDFKGAALYDRAAPMPMMTAAP